VRRECSSISAGHSAICNRGAKSGDGQRFHVDELGDEAILVLLDSHSSSEAASESETKKPPALFPFEERHWACAVDIRIG
jgi:hypothetical protein